jgi:molybdopterin-dependent oxidoreductase alpha subunit
MSAPRSFFRHLHGFAPFGLGHVKPHHFTEMFRVAWRNRRNLRYAWRILSRGVCDGCALGTSGLKDWTIDGTHLCLVRLNLLELNTAAPFAPELTSDASVLRAKTSRQLRELGRIGHPLRRRKGERGFTRVSFDEAFADIGARWRRLDPHRTAMFVTSRGVTNEVYYVAQKVMRFLGSNNVDNSARLCHSPSTAALKSTVGVAATTCSYTDWFTSDLIVFFGSNPANDQPVAMKYLAEAKKRGARVITVNAAREPGMARYWIPSNPDSALFGTNISDRFFLVKVGGDLAFLNAVAKRLIERDSVAHGFITAATTGFSEWKAQLEAQSIADLAVRCGLTLAEIDAFADEIARADKGVLVWSMGITQHAHGADTVRAIANLGLLKEWVGRDGCGLMPIRGHSGVQGVAEMGAYATAFPGGIAVNAENAARFGSLWGFDVPSRPGLTTTEWIHAAARGDLYALWCIGGNFLETMPDPAHVERALARIPLRVHTDIVLTNQMLVEPDSEDGVVYVFPSRTRYEQVGGGTETSTERRVIFSPFIPGKDCAEARSEWEMLLALARAVAPDRYARIHFEDAAAIRAEIARAVPSYAGIEKLAKQGDQFQWGGPHLCAGRQFPTPDGKAHFVPVSPPAHAVPGDGSGNKLLLATRRGKQFNSMVQADVDPLTGAARDHVFIAAVDAARLGIAHDQPIRLRSERGEFRGRAFVFEVAPGTVQGHWPEVNALLPNDVIDAEGGVPDYNVAVSVERAS